MNYFVMQQSFSKKSAYSAKKNCRRNPNFAGPSTQTCARHDGHSQSSRIRTYHGIKALSH